MKPRLFIGSAAESLPIVSATLATLTFHFECNPWPHVFSPTDSTLSALIETLQTCDFALFVLEPLDAVMTRDTLSSAARDNVVLELGISAGILGRVRTLFAVPDKARDMHIPSDLIGLTALLYETERSDGNLAAAVAAPCGAIVARMNELGYSAHRTPPMLTELAYRYEGSDLIQDQATRIATKDRTFNEMKLVCMDAPLNKDHLRAQNRYGFFMALAAAIIVSPEARDPDRVIGIRPSDVPRGNAQHKMLDALEAIDAANLLPSRAREKAVGWCRLLPGSDPAFEARLPALEKGRT